MGWIRRENVNFVAGLIAVLVWVPVHADEADDQYAVAVGHYVRARWEFAAEEFEAYLAEYPDHSKSDEALFFLGEACVQSGRYTDAHERFDEYLQRNPNAKRTRSALFRAGETAYLQGKHDAAQAGLSTFSSRYSNDQLNAYALTYLGDIALKKNTFSQAETYYRHALERFPQNPRQDNCRFGLARSLEKQDGSSEEARRLYLALAAKTASPLADEAQFHLGAMQYASGRFEEATATFDAFEVDLSKSPWRATARLARGWALWKLGRMDEASDFFGRAVAHPKIATEARYWLGLTQKSRENWDAAATTFLEAIEAEPKHELALPLRFQAGDALLRAGDLVAAREQFEHAIRAEGPPSEWIDDALRGLVQTALLEKNHNDVERYAAALGRDFPQSPLIPDTRRMRFRSLLAQKEYTRARDLLEPVVSADSPKPHAEDQYLYSLACRELGQYEEALSALSAVLDSTHESSGDEHSIEEPSRVAQLRADAQRAKASTLVRLERFDEAVEPLDSFLDFLETAPEPDSAARTWAQLAVCHARSERLDQAKQAHQQLIEKYHSHEVVGTAVEQLAEIAYEAGDFAWSGELFSWLIDQEPSGRFKLQGLSGLAWSQSKTGQPEAAAATFEQLLETDPDAPTAAEAAFARGCILQTLGRYDAALEMYDRVIEDYPESEHLAESLWADGRLRDQLDRDIEAASRYETLAEKFPEFDRIDIVLYNWAWTLLDTGQIDEAHARFRRIHETHRQSNYWADATFRLSQHHFQANELTDARQLAELVLAENPDTPIRENLLYLLGRILADDEKWEEARAAFDTLVADFPESPLGAMAQYGAAEAVFWQGNYPAAGELLEALAEKTQNRDESWTAIVHLRLAQSLAYQRQWAEAFAIASAIGARYPNFAKQHEVDYVIGRCLASRADFQDARDAYRKVIHSPNGEKTETAAKAQLMIAESYFHQKAHKTALREYLRLEILYDYPELQAAAVLQAAKCHELLGEPREAEKTYSRLLELYPKTAAAREAAQRQRTVDHEREPPTTTTPTTTPTSRPRGPRTLVARGPIE